jgi:DNA-binding MarR family transcriptional regulator
MQPGTELAEIVALCRCCNVHMMTTLPASVVRQASELDVHYRDIWRSFSSRKARTRLQQGIASELSPIQLYALVLLGEEPLRIGALADKLGLATSTVTRLVDRLERMGLAVRHVSDSDRRAVTVKLTSMGKRAEASAAKRRLDYFIDILTSLVPAERKELVRLFAKIASVQAVDGGAAHHSAKRAS